MATVYNLAGGVYVDAKRGPSEQLHAVSWKPNRDGARRAACGKVGRFLPPRRDSDFAAFPKGAGDADDAPPPRCERCLMAQTDSIAKCG